MELHPTPSSWRVALGTAFGATAITMIAVLAALRAGGGLAWLWWAVALYGVATARDLAANLSTSLRQQLRAA